MQDGNLQEEFLWRGDSELNLYKRTHRLDASPVENLNQNFMQHSVFSNCSSPISIQLYLNMMGRTSAISMLFVSFMSLRAFGFTLQYDITRSRLNRQFSLGGFLDSVSEFWKSRQGDFVRLEDTSAFGPGPCLILYNIPKSILDEEIQDMISDGAPLAFRKGIQVARIVSSGLNDALLTMTVEEALTTIMEGKNPNVNFKRYDDNDENNSNTRILPILLFSGFENSEMMHTFRILSYEIIQEIGIAPACAKTVPNSMKKQLQQVLNEISGDHNDAIISN
jgi:hypothetical protein